MLVACGPEGTDGADELPVIPDSIAGCDVADRGVLNLWLMGHGLPPAVDAIPAPEPGWATYSDPGGDHAFAAEVGDDAVLVYGSADEDGLLRLVESLTTEQLAP